MSTDDESLEQWRHNSRASPTFVTPLTIMHRSGNNIIQIEYDIHFLPPVGQVPASPRIALPPLLELGLVDQVRVVVVVIGERERGRR